MKQHLKKELFFVQGMTCTACSSGIESALKRKKGIETIQVDLLNHKAIVVFDEELITLDEIFAFISKLGYTPKKQSWVEKIDHRFLTPKRKILISACLTLIALYLGMAGMISPSLIPSLFTPTLNLTLQLLCALGVMHMGRDFYLRGFKSLIALHPTMDTLVALGSGSALLYSLFSLAWGKGEVYFESVCVIILFVLIGKTIEEKAKENTQSSLLSLASLKESTLIRITQDHQEPITAQQIQIGDILQIAPQTIIPTEGILIEGSANLDLSNLTGESLPLHKKIGDILDSGALNLNTTFLMQCTQKPQDSNYWKILDLVQNALVSKPPIAKLADQIARYFVPLVILIATLSALSWGLITQNPSIAFEIFCSVLLISCPCALGLATPLALNIANNLSNQQGIFFKDAGILEGIGKTQIIFFDKTGTLTQKELHISKIVPLSEISQERLLQITASLENHSPHIIAQSILQESKHLPLLESQNVKIQEGFGISGIIEGRTYKVGNAQIFKQMPQISQISQEGLIVWIGEEGEKEEQILGYILLQEKLREETLEVIQSLKRDHIKPVLLSGDRKENVEKIAQLLEIDFHAQALPQDKLAILESQKDKMTMMVGDGINDMLALSSAKISVSMGEGSKGAMASSSLIILNNHLKNIPYAIALSQATLRNIKQNLFWAFGYNALMIPIACGALYPLGIVLSPMLASLAMTLSSLSVVANAQRLKKFKGDLMHTLILQVPSMHCSHCTGKIKTFLSDVKGVGEVKFDLESKNVEVSYLPPATEEQIKEAIRDCGFEVS